MLLIGSGAARVLFNGMRAPSDIDLVAEEHELSMLRGYTEVPSKWENKRIFKRDGFTYEVEIARPGTSAALLLQEFPDNEHLLDFGMVEVASADQLLTLKKSHVWYKHNWDKTFFDYRFLQSNGAKVIPDLLNLRIQETKDRVGYKDPDFDVDNEEFFRRSERSVKRVIPHDEIHEIVKFFGRPMFEQMKTNKSRAAISYEKFCGLGFDLQVKAIQEEIMVLAAERYIIPDYLEGKNMAPGAACFKVTRQMCFNYLPFQFRFFAVDNFDQIFRSIPNGFERPVIDRVNRLGAK